MISKLKLVARLGTIIWILSSIFFVAYNFYFGWNAEAESELERIFDDLYKYLMSLGLLLFTFPFVRLYSKFIWSNDE